GAVEWKSPSKRSALAKLWPIVRAQLPPPADGDAIVARPGTASPLLVRLPLDYRLPDPRESVPHASIDLAAERFVREFDWAQATAAAIGTAAHRLLAEIGRAGRGALDQPIASRARIERELVNEGLDRDALPAAIHSVGAVIARVTLDGRGHWLFDPSHEDAQSELA